MSAPSHPLKLRVAALLLLAVLATFVAVLDRGPTRDTVRVAQVIDGDTLVLDSGEHVRLLGINTPEVQTRKKAGEPLGDEARQLLRRLADDGRLHMEQGAPARDKYDRLLAHLFDPQGTHINRELVTQGLAIVSIHPPNTAYTRELLEAQAGAIERRAGIWGHNAYSARALDQAAKRQRGWQRLHVRVSELRKGKNFHRLVIDDSADLRIPRANLDYFPDLQQYVGRSLEVRGWLSKRGDHYSMLIRHPSAILVR